MSVPSLSKRRIFIICVAFVAVTVGLFFYWQNRVKPLAPQLVHFGQLTLERTGCLGSCPMYTVTIERNGRVTYRTPVFHSTPQGGIKETAVVKLGQMPANSLHALITAVESPEYTKLEADYSLGITDFPSTIIEVSSERGFTRTHVYAVPCEKDAKDDRLYQELKSDSPPVPDIFCAVERLADIGSCALYWSQSTKLPTPLRCKVTP